MLPLLLLVLQLHAEPCDPPTPLVQDLGTVVATGDGVPVALPPAEDYAVPLDHGFWQEQRKGWRRSLVQGWVDLSVKDHGHRKALFVKVRVTRENGAEETTLHRLRYTGDLPGDRERWGTDTIEILPVSPHHGRLTDVTFTYGVQADADGDGRPDLLESGARYRLARYADLKEAASVSGVPEASGENPDALRSLPDTSLARVASTAFRERVPPTEVSFSPYDEPEQVVLEEIRRVTRARAEDGGHHTIHGSIFNINDDRIVEALIAAHQAGVEVRLLTAAHQMEAGKSYQTGYRRLQQAGVEVTGVRYAGDFATNHTKFAVFDGDTVTTGSLNWETGATEENAENLLRVRSPEVAAVYEEVFASIGGGPLPDRHVDPDSRFNVWFSRQHDLAAVIARELDRAEREVVVTMFTLRHMEYQQDGQARDLLDALVRARQRGVAVTVLTERSIADGGEYHGRITADDPTDEWLADQGIHVVEVDIRSDARPYASMHHKFAVVDAETTLTGSANWFYGSQVSDDDLVVIRDRDVALTYLGEARNLQARHDPGFDRAAAPATGVSFEARHDRTRPGEEVYVVGDIPELGGWDPSRAVPLSATAWPRWSGRVAIPSGVHFEYKYLVKDASGAIRWEAGGNRRHTAAPAGGEEPVADAWR